MQVAQHLVIKMSGSAFGIVLMFANLLEQLRVPGVAANDVFFVCLEEISQDEFLLRQGEPFGGFERQIEERIDGPAIRIIFNLNQ